MNETNTTHNSQKLTTGVLVITAVLMIVGILVIPQGGSAPVMASGMIDRGGDYVLCVGQFNTSTEQVYVTDAAAQRLNSYAYDQTRRQLILWDSVDLKRTFGEAKP